MNSNAEQIQKIRMCRKTYFNMYGKQPHIQDMIAWLGEEYEGLIIKTEGIFAPAAGGQMPLIRIV